MRSDATSQGGWRVWDGRRTIASCVYTISPSETGTTSNGSIAVAIAAPQKKAWLYLVARETEGPRTSARAPQPAAQPSMQDSTPSISETSHQPQPSQWQKRTRVSARPSSRSTAGWKALKRRSNAWRYCRANCMHSDAASQGGGWWQGCGAAYPRDPDEAQQPQEAEQ